MNNNTLIIAGSARSDGHTMDTVERLNKTLRTDVIDLLDHNIGFYDYEYGNQDDDFIALSQKMIAAQKVVFATPVYWYAMSAPLKVFFDRFSDLVRIRKEDGRAMKDKEMYVLVNGSAPEMPEYFTKPFEDTCAYLDMMFCGHHYVYTGGNEVLRHSTLKGVDNFGDKIVEQCPELSESLKRRIK